MFDREEIKENNIRTSLSRVPSTSSFLYSSSVVPRELHEKAFSMLKFSASKLPFPVPSPFIHCLTVPYPAPNWYALSS